MKAAGFLFCILLASSSAHGDVHHFAIEDGFGASCFSVQAGTEAVQFQVVAYYTGLIEPGAGFEFRITGVPLGWSVSATPNPDANVEIGDPFGNGVNLAFPSCAPGENGRVVLYDVSVFPTTESIADLEVAAHAIPSNPNFACPLLTGCFFFGAWCFPEDQVGIIRGDGGPCTVGVATGSWSIAKRRYR